MKVFHLIRISCFSVSVALGQQAEGDSAKTYQVSEVVVTATRIPISAKDSPSPVEVIGSNALRNLNGGTIADALRSSSSIFINDYGANGALKTVTLRGTSAQQLLVLVDGNRFNSFQNGLVDASLLPLNNIERIEIVRGGSSALYGADALGGVVNILTRRPTSELLIRTDAATGSFGFQKYSLEAQGNLGPVWLLVGYADDRGKDDYPSPVPNSNSLDTTVRRQNADFHRRQIYFSGTIKPDDRSLVTLLAQNILADRGVPGPLFAPGSTSQARQADNDANFLASYLSRNPNGTEFELQTGFHHSLQRYLDPDPSFPIDSYYENSFVNLNPQVRFLLSPNERLAVGGEFAEGILGSNDFDNRITRVQKSFYVSNELQFDFQRTMADRISLYQTIRYDNISDVGYAVVPKVGINVRVMKEGEVHLRASLGQNFRAPTFNDMYYRGFGNPNLKPERSTSFDAGVTAESDIGGRQSVEFTYFHIDTENRILFDLASFVPVNIGRAVSRGFEVKYDGRFLGGMITLGANYTFDDARKKNRSSATDSTFDTQLLFVPRHLANLSVALHVTPATLNIIHTIVGSRYTSEDNSTLLSTYRLTHANVVLNFPFGRWKFFAKFEVNNLFDYNYEVFLYFPMPKRNYRATFSIEY